MPQTGIYHDLIQPDVRIMLTEDDREGLRVFGEALYPVVIAEVLDGLSPDEAWKVIGGCTVERQAEIFEFIEPHQQMELVQSIDRQQLSRLIEVMSSDDRVDLLSHMDEEQVEQLLPLIAQAEREDIRRLLSYDEDSCGSIMTTEYASLPEHLSVRDALERLRQQAPDRETIYYIFICDEARHLHGVITLRQLILARPTQSLDAVMRRDVIAVRVDEPTENAARELGRFDLLALPVVDEEQRLVGIITHDDVLDLVQEAAEEDAYRQSAMEPLENSYFSTPILTIAHKRGVWLLALSVMSLVTAAVARAFEAVGDRHSWMECFYPLVLASGGNTGSQSATLIIRAMGLSELSKQERRQALWRELCTGLILGGALGLFIFIAVQPLFGHSPLEAAVVGTTIAVVVTMGAFTGSYLPMIFERLGMDPAVMSNPLIASLSDMFATAIYFTVAIILLEQFFF
ncbi:MAG TPA: magnesium transporter [Planctomycetaceae bacterium]|nr:magnesium transporter [Planctomycetaceae bacterium]